MAIEVTCDSCFYEFSVKDQHAGKRGKCPECGESVMVPGGGRRPQRSRSGAPATSRRSSSSGIRKNPSSGSSSKVGVIVAGSIAAVAVVGFLVYAISRGSGTNNVAANQVAANDQKNNAADNDSKTKSDTQEGSKDGNSQKSNNSKTQNVTATSPTSPPVDPAIPADNKESNTSTGTPGNTVQSPGNSPPTKEMSTKELVALVEPSVVRVNAVNEENKLEWHGSGFIIDESGVIATNHHVVAGAHKVVIEFSDKKMYPAEGYYKMDQKLDIAIIKAKLPPGYRALPLAAAPSEKGEEVVAFGCPHGLDFTITDGTVSALRSSEDMKRMVGRDGKGKWIQTSAPISPGNSGGPLVNMKGEVIGINSLTRTTGQNLNFAISASDVRQMFESRGETLVALSRATKPKGGTVTPTKKQQEEAAKMYLAQIESVSIKVFKKGDAVDSESQEKIGEAIEALAKRTFRNMDIATSGIASQYGPQLVLTVEMGDGVETGTAEVSIEAELIYVLQRGNLIQIIPLWDTRGNLGSGKKFRFRKDPLKYIDKGMKEFFQKMENEVQAARKRAAG